MLFKLYLIPQHGDLLARLSVKQISPCRNQQKTRALLTLMLILLLLTNADIFRDTNLTNTSRYT